MILTFCLFLSTIFSNTGSTVLDPELEKDRMVALKVVVKGVRKVEGTLRIAIYDNEKAMNRNDLRKAVGKGSIVATKHSPHLDFQLAEGTYAVVVLHDLNNNKVVDKNWLGQPTEPVGITNGFKSKKRKPTFAECSFSLRQSKQQVEVVLENF
jgi:uncharacterized protein (DUF2141 family)